MLRSSGTTAGVARGVWRQELTAPQAGSTEPALAWSGSVTRAGLWQGGRTSQEGKPVARASPSEVRGHPGRLVHQALWALPQDLPPSSGLSVHLRIKDRQGLKLCHTDRPPLRGLLRTRAPHHHVTGPRGQAPRGFAEGRRGPSRATAQAAASRPPPPRSPPLNGTWRGRSAAHSRTEPRRGSSHWARTTPPGARTTPPGARTTRPLPPARRRPPATRPSRRSTHPEGTARAQERRAPRPRGGTGDHACAEAAAPPGRGEVRGARRWRLGAGRFRDTASAVACPLVRMRKAGPGARANGRAQEAGRARRDARVAIGCSGGRRWRVALANEAAGAGVWPRGRCVRHLGAERALPWALGGGGAQGIVRCRWLTQHCPAGEGEGRGRGRARPLLERALGGTDRPGCCFWPAGARLAWRAVECGVFLVGWGEQSGLSCFPAAAGGASRLEPSPGGH